MQKSHRRCQLCVPKYPGDKCQFCGMDVSQKYSVIYVDVPWTYQDKAKSGERGVEYKYKTMKLSDIYSLPVESLAADDCCLFFWVTMPQLFNAEKVINSWGFKYKTNAFTWVKTNKKKTDTLFWGMGNWSRSNSELCLLATKGSPKRLNADVHQIIEAPRGRHSEKPDEAVARIERLVAGPYIELFARTTRPGWDVWGNQAADNVPVS